MSRDWAIMIWPSKFWSRNRISYLRREILYFYPNATNTLNGVFFFLLGWDKEKDFWPHRIPSISWGSDMLHLHQDPFRARLLRLNAHTRPKVLHRFYGGFPKNTFFLTPVVGIEKASQFLKWKKIYQGHVRALKHNFYIYFFHMRVLVCMNNLLKHLATLEGL